MLSPPGRSSQNRRNRPASKTTRTTGCPHSGVSFRPSRRLLRQRPACRAENTVRCTVPPIRPHELDGDVARDGHPQVEMRRRGGLRRFPLTVAAAVVAAVIAAPCGSVRCQRQDSVAAAARPHGERETTVRGGGNLRFGPTRIASAARIGASCIAGPAGRTRILRRWRCLIVDDGAGARA